MENLVGKAVNVFRNEGIRSVVNKTMLYIERQGQSKRAKNEHCFRDVLFINGCGKELPHPPRYRVTHQREQLSAANISSNEVFYMDLDPEQVRLYRVFIFFRCPSTEKIERFIREAKRLNKTVVFDIDDLVIDTEYTDMIPYLDTMSEEERRAYNEGVNLMKKTLCMCDYAITTTERLALELKKYVPKVFINRNTASEEMLYLSEEVLKHKTINNTVKIGYFSGSITHNDDIDYLLPVIQKIMAEYPDIQFHLVGEIQIPKELQTYKDRIVFHPFTDWKNLPGMIAAVDINIAPLKNTIFNEAKSENKWIEAALVKVPTVASDIGAFSAMIKNGETGILCKNTDEWYDALKSLVDDENKRKEIAENAYNYCREKCVTLYQSGNIKKIIEEIKADNIMFILPSLEISGGIRVAMEHLRILQEKGMDVAIINIIGNDKRKWCSYKECKIPIISYESNCMEGRIDKAVATMWSTVKILEEYANIEKRYYLVQNYETDFYKPAEKYRIGANQSYFPKVPVQFLTISKWCQEWLEQKYAKSSRYVMNGIDRDCFKPSKRVFNGKIRILIEGDCSVDYKNVDESFAVVDALDKEKYEIWYMSYNARPKENYYVDRFLHRVPYGEVSNVYKECHILLKTSLLESFSYPPLEMMATGGYNVVILNGGNREYLQDGVNCLTFQSGKIMEAVEAIERIVADEKLRDILYENGLKTAEGREWESLENDIYDFYS